MSDPKSLAYPASSQLALSPANANQPPVRLARSRNLDDEDLLIEGHMHPDVQLLRTQQQIVIEELSEGASPSHAAESAQVGRSTVYRWMKTDPAFMTALHAWRSRTRQDARDRLLSMTNKAIRCLERTMEEGNLQASLAVLRGVGVIVPQSARGAGGAARALAPAAATRKQLVMELRQLLLSVEMPAPSDPAAGSVPTVEGKS
jgi:hypothetical protein